MKKGNDIKVSIITVSLNSEKTIEQTIKSVLHQTYTNLEYIIIDGGSTDGTIDIIHKYADRIAYFVSEPDNGLYDAMNKGIEKATGELIGIINSDDWYELDALKTVVALFARNIKADVIHGGIRIYDNERFSSVYCPKTSELKLCMIPHPACFVTKKAYQKFGTFNLNYNIAADYELLAHIYTSNGQFIFNNKTLANLRLGGASDLHRKTGHDESEELKKRYNLKYTPSYLSLIKEYKTRITKFLKKKFDKLYCSIARFRLKNSNFTIISKIGRAHV